MSLHAANSFLFFEEKLLTIVQGMFTMRIKAIFFLVFAGAMLPGQSSAQESDSSAVLPTDQELAEELQEVAPLIPEEAPPIPEAAEASIARLDEAAKKAQSMIAKMSTASHAAREREKLREARSAIVQTPEMKQLRAEIDNGKTDEARRLARIAYYDALYDRLEKAVPSAKSTIQSSRAQDLSRLEFDRIRSHGETAGEE